MGESTLAGTLISNTGYPYVSTYSVTRAAVAPAVNLTRASQTVFLSERGDERFRPVTMVDLRISRPFKFGDAPVRAADRFLQHRQRGDGRARTTRRSGATYLAPGEILAPRIIRVGFSVDF